MWNDGGDLPPIFRMMWRGPQEKADLYTFMRWTAPSALLLDTGASSIGGDRTASLIYPTAHLLTPETENSTHYFWTQRRNALPDDAELTQQLHEGIERIFATEDEPMIVQVAANMDGQDFWDLHPVILNTDGGAIRVRRMLAKLIRDEAATLSQEPEIPALAVSR